MAQEISLDAIATKIQEAFPNLEPKARPSGWLDVEVPREQYLDLMRHLRDTPGLEFDYLSNLSTVDWVAEGEIELVVHLVSMEHLGRCVVRTRAPRNKALFPSVTPLWPTADWHEREAWDLMGARFEGHPNLRRILMQEHWEGHPLRKDYVDRRPPRVRQTRETYRP